MGKILATHTGSLIRPPELLSFLAAGERGESFDEAAYAETLQAAVQDVVKRQIDAGIDIVDDGEMGKASWITYLYERVSGLEARVMTVEGASMMPPSRDRQQFPGAYAELDALDEAAVRESNRAADSSEHEDEPRGDQAIEWVCTAMNMMTGWYGGEESGGHVGFSPVAPLTGRDALTMRDLMRELIEDRANLDYLGALLMVNARSFIHITMVLFDTANEQQVRGAYDTSKLLVREAAKHGYGEYRAHLDFMDIAADQNSFGDHADRRFIETIKDAVDPNGILAPGKQGIWPASMRAWRDG